MVKIASIIFLGLCLFSCQEKINKNTFRVSGNIKNASDQKIYLEQIYFSDKAPEILDTSEIKNGKFELEALGNQEGLYHLKMEKDSTDYIFINDKNDISLNADINNKALAGYEFNTAANLSLKKFLFMLDEKIKTLNASTESMSAAHDADSSLRDQKIKHEQLADQYKRFVLTYLDTCSDPVIVMFALGYTKGIDPAVLDATVKGLKKRFPEHNEIAALVTRYNDYMSKTKTPQSTPAAKPGVGAMAPDFTMNDTAGAPFSLSQLKGKFVLVDFWASWCGPCRGENPNVVAAYNKYRNKNFTVLGVSLDDNRQKWIRAINDDHLEWQHISDLKQWSSAAVGLYGFDGIPYNVLVDPNGKIIATELRGEDLNQKLEEVLK